MTTKLDRFFESNPEFHELFEVIKAFIVSLGKVKVKENKTQISFGTSRQFAWIWIPAINAKNRPDKYIVLSFAFKNQIKNPRIVQAVESYLGRWMHHVILESTSVVDEQTRDWLKKAYQFSIKLSVDKKIRKQK